MINEKAPGYQRCLTKCALCGNDNMLPIWLGTKDTCLNDVCAARQRRGQSAAAANVVGRGHVIVNGGASAKCQRCKCLPGTLL